MKHRTDIPSPNLQGYAPQPNELLLCRRGFADLTWPLPTRLHSSHICGSMHAAGDAGGTVKHRHLAFPAKGPHPLSEAFYLPDRTRSPSRSTLLAQ
jgi:hypothetical protein